RLRIDGAAAEQRADLLAEPLARPGEAGAHPAPEVGRGVAHGGILTARLPGRERRAAHGRKTWGASRPEPGPGVLAPDRVAAPFCRAHDESRSRPGDPRGADRPRVPAGASAPPVPQPRRRAPVPGP